ncbi:MAG TPA: hypothetical protein PKA53_12310 [Sphingobacterium sp.]|nr:hypothetical protein [Sphingobacterium sp.]
MRQTEKLDLIMHGLYKRYLSGHQSKDVESLISEINLSLNPGELKILLYRLQSDGLIKVSSTKQATFAEIGSLGIEYCEENSYSYPGNPIFINNSDSKMQEIVDILNQLFSAIQVSSEIAEEQLEEISNKISSVKDNKSPIFGAVKDIITILGSMPAAMEYISKLKTALNSVF